MMKNDYNFRQLKFEMIEFLSVYSKEKVNDLFNKDIRFFVVRNVNSLYSIYIDSEDTYFLDLEKSIRGQNFSKWVYSVEKIDDTDILKELELTSVHIKDNIYFDERRIEKTNWFVNNNYKNNSNIITFFSFKGGVGRTTCMILTALDLVRRGEKIVLLDFDLEAPGLASIFSNDENDYYEVKGILDFLIDLNANYQIPSKLDINDYYFTITDQTLIGNKGGELIIFPVSSTIIGSASEYIDKLSKVNLKFNDFEKYLPDFLIDKIQENIKPSYIFLDSRTGINEISGILINRYSSKIFILLYGSQQNMFGLDVMIKLLRNNKKPFFLVNTPVPEQETERKEELEYFINTSYEIFSDCFYNEEENLPDINDESAPHYPININYNKLAVNLNSYEKISGLLRSNDSQYRNISDIIQSDKNTQFRDKIDISIITYFSKIIPDEIALSENEFKDEIDLINRFYPRKDYKFIFDTNKFLILGDKGIGKTALYSVLNHQNYTINLAKFCGIDKKTIENDIWVPAFDRSPEFPTKKNFDGIKQFSISEIQTYWLILLLRSFNKIDKNKKFNKLEFVTCSLADIKEYACNPSIGEKIEEYLNEINKDAIVENKIYYFVYDYLDFNIPKEEKFRGNAIGALLSLWYDYSGRYSNLKSKIFLRNDIFEREVETETDKVKIKNYSVNLAWEYNQLLNIVWKRLLSFKEENESIKKLFSKYDYCIHSDYRHELGLIPMLEEKENREILDYLFGKYMGGNNKAFPYNWIIYHVSDAKQKMFPRSILTLFATAAKKQENDTKETRTPFRPYNIELAMNEVSTLRVDDLKEEYPELKTIFEKLHDEIQQFPIKDEELKLALTNILENEGNIIEVINKLIDIGVLYQYKYNSRKHGLRYHIPDLYLFGLQLRRRGPGSHKILYKK